MKKFIILSALFATLTITSCSEDNTFNPDIRYVEPSPKTELYNPILEPIFIQLDSLNARYQDHPTSRASIDIYENNTVEAAPIVGLADKAGWWIGGIIGSKFGHPELGKRLGGAGASALAKFIADEFLSDNSNMHGIMVLDYDCCIQVSLFAELQDIELNHNNRMPDNGISPLSNDISHVEVDIIDNGPIHALEYSMLDSVGYNHNNLMYYFDHNYTDYLTYGQPDKNKILDKTINYFFENGMEIPSDPNFRFEIMVMISDLADMVANSINSNSSLDNYVAMQSSYMKCNYSMNNDEIAIYENFEVKIAKKCANLSSSEIHEYAQDLNNLIISLDVTNKLKQTLAEGAQYVINSALCWNQFYE
ncbi:hypothetical protein [Duncaniella sp.]|uniref:hypothetical protein n=1 Tax=Duncaniella sp. TaxID=2518496 RepID=UPI0023C7E2F7|nr:hypothetical protein [Duncaniella sp.]MDE5689520.1 hypothetical protein [Duncaniella sp.]MDE5904597.1 hypothetical protein [Duncaniella sp.]